MPSDALSAAVDGYVLFRRADLHAMKRLLLGRSRLLETVRNAATAAVPNWVLDRQAKAFLRVKKA